MELVDVKEVFCKDCEFVDKCSTIFCDVHNMPRVIIKQPQYGEWHDCYLLDSVHQNFTCSVCNERLAHHVHEPFPIYCPYCGARMVDNDE